MIIQEELIPPKVKEIRMLKKHGTPQWEVVIIKANEEEHCLRKNLQEMESM